MTKDQSLRLLDILANAFAAVPEVAARDDLMTALTNLRQEIVFHPLAVGEYAEKQEVQP